MRHSRSTQPRPTRRQQRTAVPGRWAPAEPAAPECRGLYRAIFERSQVIQVLIDPATGAIVDANPAACAFYGYGRGTLRGMLAASLSLGLPGVVQAQMRGAQAGQILELAARHRRGDGESREVEIRFSTLEAAGRQLLCAAVTDITERVRAEALLSIQHALSAALAATTDLADALRLMLDAAMQIEGVDCGAVYLPDPRTGDLDLALQRGLSPEFAAGLAHYDAASQRAAAVRAGKPACYRPGDAGCSEELRAREGLRIILSVPVLDEGRLLCEVVAASRTAEEFPPAISDALEALARQVGSALARTQAGTALREKEEQLRLALEGSGLGTWDWNVPSGTVHYNQRWAEMLGYTLDEVDPHLRTWERWVHPDDACRASQLIEEHFAGRLPVHEVEYRIRHKDGHWVWLSEKGRVIERGPDGRPLRVCGTALDITDRVRMDEALRASEERYRSVVTALAEGIVLQHASGEISACNASAERILGLTVDQMMGRAPIDPRWRAIREDGSPLAMGASPLMATLRTGKALRDVILAICKPDGELTWTSTNTEPLWRPGESAPYAVVAGLVDITTLKRAEIERQATLARLAEREAVLDGLVACSSDGILMTDEAGTLTEWNEAQERITGIARGEAIGHPIWQVQLALCPPERRNDETLAAIKAAFAGVLHHGQAPFIGLSADLAITRPDGERRIEQSVSFCVPTVRGFRFAAIMRDVTGVRRDAENLVQRQKLESIGLLAGWIAHDFNNLSQAALGQTELALSALAPDHPAAQHLRKVVVPIQRAADLTRQLMAYAGLGKYLAQAEDLAQIIRDSAGLARAALPGNAQLLLELSPDLPPIYADRNQVQQALMNLVLNAGEAIEDGQGTVTIRAGRRTVAAGEQANYVVGVVPGPGEYVYLQVADTGAGMDARTLARACEPFFSTRFTGRGLGLPAVLGILRSHAGGLMLESQPGQGTVVTVLWPVAQGAAVALPEPGRAAGGAEAAREVARPRTVLVVDDEAPVLEALADCLSLSGADALTASDGQQAVAVFAERHAEIGLVILDVLMPVMNGGVALRELRRIDPTVPVVLASGYDGHEIEARLAEWQISERPDAFLQKPFGLAEAQAVVNRFVGR